MILPQGVSKASGLAGVLDELHIQPDQVAAIGDAENDMPMLRCCGLGVAVNNAVPKLKTAADLTTQSSYGKGIAELIDRLLQGET